MAFGQGDRELSPDWEEFASKIRLFADVLKAEVEERMPGETPHQQAGLMQLGVIAEALERAFAE